ncbi:MAG: hypothetical protein KKF57_07995 [Firmicutes bacterium]|nr:hypothetical protein [Bacillota bacterium]
MALEWFNRVTGELQEQLESICEEYDQIGHMTIDQSTKHPRIEFFVDTLNGEREYFCTLLFDPHNEEFYLESFDVEFEQPARVILADIEDVIDAVHESFHAFLNGEHEMYYVDEAEDGDDDDEDDEDSYEITEIEDEINEVSVSGIEWETPEVTAFYIEDEVETTYQFGVVSATGEGVLRRVNRLWTDDEIFKDESQFTFAKEEASTIIAMIASHMDDLPGFEDMIIQ